LAKDLVCLQLVEVRKKYRAYQEGRICLAPIPNISQDVSIDQAESFVLHK
jgi:hypothetical protein